MTDGLSLRYLTLSLRVPFKEYITALLSERIDWINKCCTFPCEAAVVRACMRSVQTQLRPCVAPTTTTGRWAEYEFASDETSPTVELQRLFVHCITFGYKCRLKSELQYFISLSCPQNGNHNKSGRKTNRIHKPAECQKTYRMMQELGGITYINTLRYIILMRFSAATVCRLSGRWGRMHSWSVTTISSFFPFHLNSFGQL